MLVLAVAYADTLLVLGAGSAVFFDPLEQGCLGCPANHLLVSAEPQAAHDVARAGLLVAFAWSAAFAALVLVRLGRATGARRRIEIPVLLPAAVAVALFGARALHGAERGFLSNDPTDRALWAVQVATLLLVAASVAWRRVHARRIRGRVARLVVDLGRSARPGGLREQLAQAFGDPSLELLHARDDEAGWIDGDGRAAELPHGPERQVTRLLAGGRELSAVVHRPGLFEEAAIAAELADTARPGARARAPRSDPAGAARGACAHRAGASSPARTPSGARSSATCTTEPSSAWPPWRSRSGWRDGSWRPGTRTSTASSAPPRKASGPRSRTCASSPMD